jgi:ankyrin repeat protein
MATVLNGRTLQQMNRFFEFHGTRENFIRQNQEALKLWLQQLGEAEYIAPLAWIEQMTLIDRTIRPSCETLLQAIYRAEDYCGQCCSPGRRTSAIAVDHLGAVSDPSVLETSLTSFFNSFTIDANTAWFMIADSGKVNLLRHFFEPSRGRQDINAHNKDGVTALYLLASRGHRDAAKYIIDQGAAVEETLQRAVTDGQATAVEILLPFYPDVNLFDDIGITLLHEAAFLGYREVAKLLLDSGADIDARSRAHRYGNLSDSQPGEDGRTPLMAATATGATSTVALLIDNGADLNAQDAIGNTALVHASLYGWPNIVSLLLDHNADAEVSNDSQRRALHLASWNGHHEIVRQLLKRNADPNVTDAANLTPLHLAAQKRREAVVALLLQYGADPRLKDSSYRTALDHARTFPNIARLLRDSLNF